MIVKLFSSWVFASALIAFALPSFARDENSSTEGQAVDDRIMTDLYQTHPSLGKNVSFLRTLDRVVENDDGIFQLFAGENLVMTLEIRDDAISIKQGPSDFSPDMIEYRVAVDNSNNQAQLREFIFTFKDCSDNVIITEKDGEQQKVCTILSAVLNLSKGEETHGNTPNEFKVN